MKQLSLGTHGPEVQSLRLWLNKFGTINESPDVFDEDTKTLVIRAQKGLGLVADGIVGPRTTVAFLQDGWLPPGYEQPSAVSSPYPNVPTDYRALSQSQKIAIFGSPGQASADGSFGGHPDFHLQTLHLEQWFPNISGVRLIPMNAAVAFQWSSLFDEIVSLGLQGLLLSCAGSYNPRYVRGSTTTISSHAFGTAVDFNAPQNALGASPARKGEKGSLVEIVRLLPKYKMWSGMWFSRVDGMHIESTQTDKQLGIVS